MVAHGEQTLLSRFRRSGGLPLRGRIEIDDGSVHAAQAIPARGTVCGWASAAPSRLRIGDEVGIGKLRFTVAARIVRDIDRSVGFASFAPRVLMNDADLAATGLLQEGSRIIYRLMIAGDARQVNALRDELKTRLSGNEKLEDVRDARPEIRTALERAENFLGLAALTAAILAGAAMALAARRFVLRHLDGCAVMRCLGAQQGQVLRLFLYQFLLLGIIAVLLGCGLGYVTSRAGQFTNHAHADLLQPCVARSRRPVALRCWGLLFAIAAIAQSIAIARAAPRLGAPQASVLVYGLAVLAGLFLWQADSAKLVSPCWAGCSGLLCFGMLAWLLLHGLARYSLRFHAQVRYAFNNLARHGRDSALQVVALGLGGMALLLLTLVRGDLLQSWQGKLPPGTPNRFVVNIQPDQQQAVRDFFARQSVPQPQLLPMVRGRLVAISTAPISGDSYADPRARELVEREFNLSYAEQMPEWNELVSGSWWSPT